VQLELRVLGVVAIVVRRDRHLGSIWTETLPQRLPRECLNINTRSTCQASVTCRGEEHLLACIYSTLAVSCVEARVFIYYQPSPAF
jgi:hypothetical protein